MTGIYRYTNLINGKRYIGQAINLEDRHNGHIYAVLNNRPGQMIEYAMIKYGIENFRYEVLEYCSEDELNELEIYWIDYYLTQHNRKDGRGYGYNFTKGGGGYIPKNCKGHIPWNKGLSGCYNEEQIKRISNGTKKGMHEPEAWERYINSRPDIFGEKNPFYGKHHTEETKERIRNKQLGKKVSEETKIIWCKQRTGRKWVYNEYEECFVEPNKLNEYLEKGYKFGRLPAVCKKISKTLTE